MKREIFVYLQCIKWKVFRFFILFHTQTHLYIYIHLLKFILFRTQTDLHMYIHLLKYISFIKILFVCIT